MSDADPTNPTPDLSHEYSLRQAGCTYIAGVDEAGRGAWAGPVVAAAVVLPLHRSDLAHQLHGVRDSKKMTPAQREAWLSAICELALATGVGIASAQEVDRVGLLPATRIAMLRALDKLRVRPQHVLIDHIPIPEVALPQTPITRGDGLVLSIAAASILAKVTRDRTMCALEADFPGYGFARHKGYGTPHHRLALQRLGPCAIHRMSYAPVSALASKKQ